MVRLRLRVEGTVQGVGFRPFVYALANRYALAGLVGNDPHGVFIEIEGPPGAVESFVASLESEPPPRAVVERVDVQPLAPTGQTGFTISESLRAPGRGTGVAADTATCADCLRELFDPTDRRYRYPFVNCTNCGPRFTIVRDIPYDRAVTTMAGFAMCPDCAFEYRDPADRRFHAEPVCCPACGPTVRLLDAAGAPVPAADPVAAVVEVLRAGNVVAIKGLGGYHLAADAASEVAVGRLRARKHREDKPFAVMAADVAAAGELVELDAVDLLAGPERPIVLLPRRSDASVAGAVAPGNRSLGVLLPYTPLHHLIARGLGRPFVLTSGNVSDEPIAYRDDDALGRLAGIADHFLVHDRAIHVRVDDSVLRARPGAGVVPLRRSRGYVPGALVLPWSFPRPVLACGAELKNTFCLGHGDRAVLSHHIGDLSNAETLRSFADGVAHFERLFEVTPEVVVHDLHPEYLSTKYALDRPDVEVVGVQHHHAHIASCLADNGESGPVIGVAFDGTGFGDDGTVWGGELLVADRREFRRVAHLECCSLPGGEAAIRNPWRMAASWLDQAYAGHPPDTGVAGRNAGDWDKVLAVARSGANSPLTSSAGRLFDAVAAILGVRDAVNYEGQAAVELEQLADPAETGAYPAGLVEGSPVVLAAGELIRAVTEEVHRGVAGPVVAARFHNGLADLVARACVMIRERTGLEVVALSGGVFQNALLVGRLAGALERAGFRVLSHRRVPPNDGGVSLGQAVVAAANS